MKVTIEKSHTHWVLESKKENINSGQLPWGTLIWLARAGPHIRCFSTKYFNTNDRRMQKMTDKDFDADECHCGQEDWYFSLSFSLFWLEFSVSPE